MIRITTLVGLIVLYGSAASAQDTAPDTRPGVAPDIREDESRLKLQRGDFVVVPIPISNPTLEEGLVAGAAYFYPQSEEEKKRQPASVTAAAGLYTNNDSRAFALVQQNYWKNNKWRFTGAVGGADLRVSLLAPSESNAGTSVDWRINGNHYAKTLDRWRQTLLARRQEILALGYDEHFLRKWEYYFAYCRAGFAANVIDLAQIVLDKPDHP